MATRDRDLRTIPGLFAAASWLLLAVAGAVLLLTSLTGGDEVSYGGVAAAAGLALPLLVALNGFLIVQPNQAKVAVFLGRYMGTVRRSGFHWVNPLTTRRTLSLRIRNLDTDELKVNDANGNPIEISAVIVWQVTDAAQAAFDVEDYEAFVAIQAETAVRHVASVFPYDSYEEGQESLRGAADRVIATLQERLDVAGVTVLDTRLRRLAYAPEIAADMLRRQQADAIVAARQRIVEGAVGMVDHALSSLNERDIVELDEERKAAMVSNLMVVLVSDRGAQPVVNSGSLYT
ncbi:MAG TPA: SPFH domain-containing protein [Actinomycetes bacterium]|jgi:SPFH domain / Band 7 family|nr:SPFH domain-containing protein [Actinomycetes bacterium]HEV3463403.1 SPFH domain-containing protein [Actinomycetota bacterium]